MTRPRSAAVSLRDAFVAASVAWAALLVAAPFLASRAHASALASALIVGVYGIGSLVCHQLPERSYHIWAAQMPVCARCAGIYFGGVLGALAGLWHAGRRPSARRAGTVPARDVRVALALAAVPTFATLIYEWTTGEMPSHALRAAAGVALGLVISWVVVVAAVDVR